MDCPYCGKPMEAGRIPGVSPSDLAQLSIVLLKQK